MQAHEALDILAHLPPNTPGGSEQPFSDKRFYKFWCPFHAGRKVWLQVYQPYPGAVAFTCFEGCRPHRSIYDALHARFLRRGYDRFYFQVVVTRLTTASAVRSDWSRYSQDLRTWGEVTH